MAKAKTPKLRLLGQITSALIEDGAITPEKLSDDLKSQIGTKSFYEAVYDKETGFLHFVDENGEDAYDPVYIGFSSGGGGGANNATLSASNTTGFISKTISDREDLVLSCTWSSVENEFQTGRGSLNIKVNGISKIVKDVEQGDITINMKDYLVTGGNVIKWTISDVYGNQKTLSFNITVVTTSLTSPFDATVHYMGDITFPFTATGATTKTMQFILDGSLIGSSEVTTSGRQQNFTIPKQSHGSHTFEVYFTAEINDSIVESNHLYYDIIFVEEGNKTPIIASSFHVKSISQFYTASIPWIAYTPGSLTSDVKLYVNGEVYQELTGVDRTMQIWPYRADEAGELLLEIETGGVRKPFELTVSETDIDVSAEENDLSLYLTSYGRNNNELNPDTWNYGNIQTVFENFNFVSDGWQLDNEGNTVMRVAGDARLQIPYQIFASDFRTTGKTIEFEIAARDVLNYDATILSCMSGGRGINITTQMALFASEQSSISTKYKEEEHIRISFVAEKKSGNKLLYCYINGTLARCCLYSEDDDFSQALPVDITIGSNECVTDIYNIRVYDNDLTRYQMLDNWIADTQDISKKKDIYDRNNIYDEYGKITIETLKKDVPYLVLICPVLPTFKGDKKTCSGYYVDPVHPERSFTFENATIDVQGTSSQYYWIKNIKAKFSNGVTLENGTLTMEYQLNGAGVGTNVFTYKADVASSEGFLNVILAQLYNELCPFKTPAQVDNPNVRQTIDGHPMVIFHDNGSGPEFYGKFNFNHDKGTPEVFGFEEGDESWEILQNGTERVGFRSADFSGDDWKNDFEARYPEDNTNTTKLKEFAEWIVSTDTDQATGGALTSTVKYGDVSYAHDTEEYRLAKFKHELEDHAVVEDLVFYYLFTLVFLCIDQREKNAFPTWLKRLMLWIILFYDADSSMGTDNKGNLAFDYWLEDIDFTDAGDPVFNGQNSVLWKNLRACFWDKIEAEYVRLRTTIRDDGSGLPLLSYEVVMNKIKAHIGTWCEAIYNEDAYKKYIEPFILNGDASYLPMLHGNKIEYIQWWLYNRFRYMDSLFVTGTSMEKRIMIRAHAKADITMKSYVNMYGRVYYNALIAMNRMMRGQAYEFVWAATGAEDAVIGINDADMITDIGDLAPLAPETIDISKAIRLTRLKFGDENIINNSMTEVTLGNNVLLRLIDGRNCPNLAGTVDASGCTGLEEAYFEGTSITYLKLPNGGNLKVLHLPETVTNLSLMNLTKLTELVIPSYANITTLRIENMGNLIDIKSIIESMAESSRLRIIGFDWTFNSGAEVLAFYDLLDTLRGLNESGENTDYPQMSGTIRVDHLSGEEYYRIKNRYPTINLAFNSTDTYTVSFYNGTELLGTVENVMYGDSASYIGDDLVHPDGLEYMEFIGWMPEPNNITGDTDCYAQWFDNREIRDDWSTIAARSLDGTAVDTYKIGTYKPVEITHEDGTTETITMELIAFNHDELADGVKSWESLPEIPQTAARSYRPQCSFVYNNKLYVVANGIFEYNGDVWSEIASVPSGMNLNGGSACFFNNEIYVVDSAPSTNNDYFRKMYKYNWTDWEYVCDTPLVNVTPTHECAQRKLVVYNGNIHTLGGSYTNTGNNHYKWDGNEWTLASTTPDNLYMYNIVVYNNEIHAINEKNHYKWDGNEWTTNVSIPPFTKSEVGNIPAIVHDDCIYISHSNEGVIYKWDGSVWESVVLPSDGVIFESTLASFRNKLHLIGGGYTTYLQNRYRHLILRNPRATMTFLAKNALRDKRPVVNDNKYYANWIGSDLHLWLNEELPLMLPEYLKTAIKPVNKIGTKIILGEYQLVTTEEVCWIASATELGANAGNTAYYDYVTPGEGEPYPIFTDHASRKKTTSYITRTQRLGIPQDLLIVGGEGSITIGYKNTSIASVVFGFCI